MSMHFRNVCKHGDTVSQCRCPGPKTEVLVECPPGHGEAIPLPPEAIGASIVFVSDTDTDLDALIALIKRISPIKHEPLATSVAEEWAAEFIKEGWHR